MGKWGREIHSATSRQKNNHFDDCAFLEARVWDRCDPPNFCQALRRALQPGQISKSNEMNEIEKSNSTQQTALWTFWVVDSRIFKYPMRSLWITVERWTCVDELDRKYIVMQLNRAWVAVEHMISISCWLTLFGTDTGILVQMNTTDQNQLECAECAFNLLSQFDDFFEFIIISSFQFRKNCRIFIIFHRVVPRWWSCQRKSPTALKPLCWESALKCTTSFVSRVKEQCTMVSNDVQ